MKLRLNISPCPNDTFMFDALIHGRIDTEGLDFELTFADIDELNRQVMSADKPHISKISYAVYPMIASDYKLLHSGSALGRGNGPLLVQRPDYGNPLTGKVAIPGLHTSANRLLEILHPEITDKEVMLFSDIAEAMVSGRCQAGVLIHEGRFTYREKGLELISDLGGEWEAKTGLPLPLGGIVVSETLAPEVRQTVDRVLRRSIEYAFAYPDASTDFIKTNAQEMDESVTRQHIELFVNDYSVDLGKEGESAVRYFLQMPTENLFV